MIETGFFYGTFIDPILKGMRSKVVAHVAQGESLIDIACGTGAQARQLAAKSVHVVGVDLSESMIAYAIKKGEKANLENVTFKVADATNLSMFGNETFDVATMSLALHQFPPFLYQPILNEMKRVAKRIVIVDYAVPLPQSFVGYASKLIEFLAGREHNRCFRAFYNAGGLHAVLAENGLQIEKEQKFAKGAFVLVSCKVV